MTNWVRYPPPFWAFPPWGAFEVDTHTHKGYLRVLGAIWRGISHWAAKVWNLLDAETGHKRVQTRKRKRAQKRTCAVKLPIRTKHTTAPESVVFCYRRSLSVSVPFCCPFFAEKNKHFRALSVVFCCLRTEFTPRTEIHSP